MLMRKNCNTITNEYVTMCDYKPTVVPFKFKTSS